MIGMVIAFVVIVTLVTAWSLAVEWVLELIDAKTWPTPLVSRYAMRPEELIPPRQRRPSAGVILGLGFGAAVLAMGAAIVLPPVHLPPGPRTADARAKFCASPLECEKECGPDAPAACSIAAERLEKAIASSPAKMAAAKTKIERLLDKGCQLGDPIGCDELAARDVNADGKVIAALFQRGCDLQDAEACVLLGRLYQGGQKGVPADAVRSAKFLKKACALGRNDACGR